MDRSLLIAEKPDPDLWLPDEQIKMLAVWMSRRYWRPELPTAFVNRLGKSFDKFKKLCRKQNATFRRICVSLSSWEELEVSEVYRVKLLAMLPPGAVISKAAKDWATAVDALLTNGIVGVEAEPTKVESESDLPISTFKEFKPIDFDFLSYAAGEFDLPAED